MGIIGVNMQDGETLEQYLERIRKEKEKAKQNRRRGRPFKNAYRKRLKKLKDAGVLKCDAGRYDKDHYTLRTTNNEIKLDVKNLAIIQMHNFGMDAKEISTHLDIPIDSVRKYISRGFKKAQASVMMEWLKLRLGRLNATERLVIEEFFKKALNMVGVSEMEAPAFMRALALEGVIKVDDWFVVEKMGLSEEEMDEAKRINPDFDQKQRMLDYIDEKLGYDRLEKEKKK